MGVFDFGTDLVGLEPPPKFPFAALVTNFQLKFIRFQVARMPVIQGFDLMFRRYDIFVDELSECTSIVCCGIYDSNTLKTPRNTEQLQVNYPSITSEYPQSGGMVCAHCQDVGYNG